MRSWYVLAFSPLLLLGCPAKESSSTSGASTASAAPAASSAAPDLAPQTSLAPLSDTSTATATGAAGTGPAAATGAVLAKPKPSATGSAASATAGSTNALRIKQCCDALRKSSATLAPASTEAQTVMQAVALCDGIAAAVTAPATAGQAPEFAPVRPLLQSIQGKSVPAVCQGL